MEDNGNMTFRRNVIIQPLFLYSLRKACVNIWKIKGTHRKEKKEHNENMMVSGRLKVLKFTWNFILCRKRIAKEKYLSCKVVCRCPKFEFHLHTWTIHLFSLEWGDPCHCRDHWRKSMSFPSCGIPFTLLCSSSPAVGRKACLLHVTVALNLQSHTVINVSDVFCPYKNLIFTNVLW